MHAQKSLCDFAPFFGILRPGTSTLQRHIEIQNNIIISIIMTKVQLVRAISKETGIDQPTVLATVESFMNVVKDSLISKENVYLRGFGTFDLKHRAKKTARNISKNTTIIIDAHDIPHFKPCKEFLEAVAAND